MFIAPFEVGGVLYNCSEQYFQAQKAAQFGDDKMEAKIMAEEIRKK